MTMTPNSIDPKARREAEATLGATGNLSSAICAYMSALSISDGEGAVAWRWKEAETDPAWEFAPFRPMAPGLLVQPLFTHPAPVAAQPAEGLLSQLYGDRPPSTKQQYRDAAMRMIEDATTKGGDLEYPTIKQQELVEAFASAIEVASSPTPPTAPAVPDSAVKLAVEAVEGLANGFLPGGPEDMKGALRHIVTAIRALATNPEPKP